MYKENVSLKSDGDIIKGVLFLPVTEKPSPALIICHGALEFKENFFELSELLANEGIAALTIDMHGHGESEGNRFQVDMKEWVADIQAAIDFLENHTKINSEKIGAFGFSSGATAIFETALIDPRLKTLISLDGTVRTTMSSSEKMIFQVLILLGKIKKMFTKKDMRISLVKMFKDIKVASDPEVNQKYLSDQRFIEAFTSVPFPGITQCFFVDTINRVDRINAPTLVMHGEDDEFDPPETAKMLYDALTCEKQLHILPESGHVGYLDKQKDKVINLTVDWTLKHLK